MAEAGVFNESERCNRCGYMRWLGDDCPRCEASEDVTVADAAMPPCDDADVMRLWRECGLPEYFLGNGGTNHKLVAFAEACRRAPAPPAIEPTEAQVEAAVRAGCERMGIYMRETCPCLYPACDCKKTPAAIRAALKAGKTA